MILTTAVVALTALLALPTSANPVTPRAVPPGPQPKGQNQGALFYGWNFTTYARPHCNGKAQVFNAAMGWYIPVTMQSYHLSEGLKEYMQLDFYVGDGSGLVSKEGTDGDVVRACGRFDGTAGINATTNDKGDVGKGHGRWEGCHDLVREEWCALIWEPGS